MRLAKSTIAATFAAVLIGGLTITSASAAVKRYTPEIGRVEFSERVGITRAGDVKYENGRVAPKGDIKGIYSHTGRHVEHGRQG